MAERYSEPYRDPNNFYHYTNKDGFQGIKDSQSIAPSVDNVRDAVLGKGVYVTDLHPSNSKETILKNNYDGASHRRDDRADYFVKIPKSRLPTVTDGGSDRQVNKVRYGNRDLKLDWIKDVKYGKHPQN